MSHLLSSYIERPNRVLFETQQEGEEIILLLRAHPITNVPWIIIGSLLIVSPLLIRLALPLIGFPTFDPTLAQVLRVLTVVLELVALGYIFEQFLNYYFSVYIVTNLRVIDVDFVNLLSKKVSDAQIEDVEDVTYTQNGVVRSVFNYGNVIVQTAGAKPTFDFLAVPRPSDVTQVIGELQPRGDTD